MRLTIVITKPSKGISNNIRGNQEGKKKRNTIIDQYASWTQKEKKKTLKISKSNALIYQK